MLRGSTAYAVAALLIQGAALAGCGREAAAPVAERTEQAAAPSKRAVAPKQVAGPERLVVAFGDSLYAGYGLERGESLPDELQGLLRARGLNARVVNAGVSGETTAGGRQRLAFVLDGQPRKPDLVVLGLGGNDLLRQIPPAETRANLQAMLDELRSRGIPMVLTGIVAPLNLGPDYADAFNAIYPELAKEYEASLYPFILEGVIGQPGLMLPDGIHPSAAGVDRIGARIAPLLAERLASPAAAPA